jgi:hypothetical protein
MTTRSIPTRQWHSCDNEPLPTGWEALDEPFSAFPYGHERMVPDTHAAQRDILDRMHHDGCGGRAGRAELLTGVDNVSRRLIAADRTFVV